MGGHDGQFYKTVPVLENLCGAPMFLGIPAPWAGCSSCSAWGAERAALCSLGTVGCGVIEEGQMTDFIVSREKEGKDIPLIPEPPGSCYVSSI